MSSWSLIIGRSGADKGGIALSVARELGRRGLAVAGFVQQSVLDDAGEPSGFDVVSVPREEHFALARVSSDPTLCGYRFDERGFDRAREWSMTPADVVVIGGVGKLEAAQAGHWPVLSALIADANAAHVIACVRDTALSTIALALPDPVAYIELPSCDEELELFIGRVERACRDSG